MHTLATSINNEQLLPLIFLTYAVGFIYLLFIRHYDIYEKEPISKLILFSFFGGIVSIFVASFFYLFVHPRQNFIDAILLVGTVEELAKLITFLVLYKLIKKNFDEIVDGIIYIAALSLGFSVVENLFYALESDYPYKLLALRFLTATIGHITFSVYMGIALYIHKKVHKNYLGLIFAFLLSTLAHGFYDGVIFQPELNLFFIPLFIFLIWMSFKLLKLAYAYSKMKYELKLDGFLTHEILPVECCHCGETGAKTYRFKNQNIYVCQSCDHLLIETRVFRNLMQYYRPVFDSKKYMKKNFQSGSIYLDQEKLIYFQANKKRINASLAALKAWLNYQNQADIEKYQQKFTGKIFYFLGLRYL